MPVFIAAARLVEPARFADMFSVMEVPGIGLTLDVYTLLGSLCAEQKSELDVSVQVLQALVALFQGGSINEVEIRGLVGRHRFLQVWLPLLLMGAILTSHLNDLRNSGSSCTSILWQHPDFPKAITDTARAAVKTLIGSCVTRADLLFMPGVVSVPMSVTVWDSNPAFIRYQQLIKQLAAWDIKYQFPFYPLISDVKLSWKEKVGVVSLLLKHGVGINSVEPLFGSTVLHMLLANEHTDKTLELIKLFEAARPSMVSQAGVGAGVGARTESTVEGFNYAATCKQGRTVLHWAVVQLVHVEKGSAFALLEQLITMRDSGRDIAIAAKDERDLTAAQLALLLGFDELAERLDAEAMLIGEQQTEAFLCDTLKAYGIEPDRWEQALHNHVYSGVGADVPLLLGDDEASATPVLLGPSELWRMDELKAGAVALGGRTCASIAEQTRGLGEDSVTVLQAVRSRRPDLRNGAVKRQRSDSEAGCAPGPRGLHV